MEMLTVATASSKPRDPQLIISVNIPRKQTLWRQRQGGQAVSGQATAAVLLSTQQREVKQSLLKTQANGLPHVISCSSLEFLGWPKASTDTKTYILSMMHLPQANVKKLALKTCKISSAYRDIVAYGV